MIFVVWERFQALGKASEVLGSTLGSAQAVAAEALESAKPLAQNVAAAVTDALAGVKPKVEAVAAKAGPALQTAASQGAAAAQSAWRYLRALHLVRIAILTSRLAYAMRRFALQRGLCFCCMPPQRIPTWTQLICKLPETLQRKSQRYASTLCVNSNRPLSIALQEKRAARAWSSFLHQAALVHSDLERLIGRAMESSPALAPYADALTVQLAAYCVMGLAAGIFLNRVV